MKTDWKFRKFDKQQFAFPDRPTIHEIVAERNHESSHPVIGSNSKAWALRSQPLSVSFAIPHDWVEAGGPNLDCPSLCEPEVTESLFPVRV
jgi:hypothetical protein